MNNLTYPSRFTAAMTVKQDTITITSEFLNRAMTCTVLMPEEFDVLKPLNLLLLNDGQEADNLRLKQTLQALYDAGRLKPLLVVAIHANEDRLEEYGIAGHPDFKKRGSKADLYTQFILSELLPWIQQHTPIKSFASIAYGGFSLGGLSALDIAWNNPDIFDKAGVFSGSFWWRSKALNDGYTDADRIMHKLIRNTKVKPDLKFWLQTGTLDETADRNNNGLIDSIDDAIDLIKELEQKGYERPADIQYLEMVGGRHNVSTWAQAMPRFLIWAFGN